MTTEEQEGGYGFKFLDPTGATYPRRRDGATEMLYALPRPGEKWGPWMEHPRPAVPDGEACGSGRYHVMLKLSAAYAPANWWPWFVQFEQPVGRDDEKVSVLRLRLRRIAPRLLARALRPPFNWGNNHANLCYADLSNANLRYADLSNADLRYANLRQANLRYADLSNADLRYANLRQANLHYANLHYADLYYANLRYADLYYANLRYANLRQAKLHYADLSNADLRYADLSYADLSNAELHYADLSNADLRQAEHLTDEQLETART